MICAVQNPHGVAITQHRRVLHIQLQRERQLNALTLEMCRSIQQALVQLPEGVTTALFTGSGNRGFCGGGDVKAMCASPQAAQEFLAAEYAMDQAIADCAVPTVVVMDGITMGGGIGIAAHCSLRVVTETALLAMPETRIGIVPDVGINRLLAATPTGFGELIAATSASFGAADALHAGFADYFIASVNTGKLLELLANTTDPKTVVQRLAAAETAVCPEAQLLPVAAGVYNAAAQKLQTAIAVGDWHVAINEYYRALQAHPETGKYATALTQVSPLAAAVAFARVATLREKFAAGVTQTVAQALSADLQLVGVLSTQANFREGVRARLIDKDDKPCWQPAGLQQVTNQQVAEILRLAENV